MKKTQEVPLDAGDVLLIDLGKVPQFICFVRIHRAYPAYYIPSIVTCSLSFKTLSMLPSQDHPGSLHGTQFRF